MPLTVEPRKAGEFSLSALMLSKEIHPAAELALGVDTSLIEDRTPLVAQGMQMTPSGSNQFRKTERGYFYFEVYDPAAGIGRRGGAGAGPQDRSAGSRLGGAETSSPSQQAGNPSRGYAQSGAVCTFGSDRHRRE